MLKLFGNSAHFRGISLQKALFTLLLSLFFAAPLLAQDDEVAVSPKPGWGDFTIVEEKEDLALWQKLVLWFPNRILDFIDIFRADVGVGPSFGAAVRLTKYGQAGYRSMNPGSLRVGAFGRNSPINLETSNEFGIGPGYVNSKDREICSGEIGAALDIVIAGAYLGFCPEEAVDFIAGVFTFDLMDDDFK